MIALTNFVMENKMIINKSSFHYRLYEFYDASVPRTLCPYFWKFIALSIFSVMITVFVAFVAFFLFYFLGFTIEYPNKDENMLEIMKSLGLYGNLKIVGLSTLYSSIGISAICVFFYTLSRTIRRDVHELIYEKIPRSHRNFDFYDQYRYDKRKRKGDIEKVTKPGIFMSYLKARKEKMCPILEFKDDK